jgi:hypothetical protein
MGVSIINFTNPLDKQFFNLSKQNYPFRQFLNVDLSSSDDVSFEHIPRSVYVGSQGDLEVIGLEGLYVDIPTITSNNLFSYPNGVYYMTESVIGQNLKFTLEILGNGSVININITDQGYGYTIGDTITILGSSFENGIDVTDDITFDLAGDSVIFKNITDGTLLSIQPRLIIKAGTSCDDVIAMY